VRSFDNRDLIQIPKKHVAIRSINAVHQMVAWKFCMIGPFAMERKYISEHEKEMFSGGSNNILFCLTLFLSCHRYSNLRVQYCT